MSELLTDAEVTVLNAARSVLAGLGRRAQVSDDDRADLESMARGRFAEACDRADGAIFQTLNIAYSYCHVPLTYEQLHMRPDPSAS